MQGSKPPNADSLANFGTPSARRAFSSAGTFVLRRNLLPGRNYLKRDFFTNDPVRVDHLRLCGNITTGDRGKGLQALAGNIAVRSRQKVHRYLLGLLLLLARGDVLEPHEWIIEILAG